MNKLRANANKRWIKEEASEFSIDDVPSYRLDIIFDYPIRSSYSYIIVVVGIAISF